MDASIVIIALLAVIAEQVAIDASAVLREIELATRHYVDVSAVVEMVQQLEELDENALERLKSYPESVRAAAWLHYINQLGSALQHAQADLNQSYVVSSLATLQTQRKAKVDELRSLLDKAILQSGQTGLRVV